MASGHVALMSVHTGTVVPIVLSYTFVDIMILKGLHTFVDITILKGLQTLEAADNEYVREWKEPNIEESYKMLHRQGTNKESTTNEDHATAQANRLGKEIQ
jgi:hypothetical protein